MSAKGKELVFSSLSFSSFPILAILLLPYSENILWAINFADLVKVLMLWKIKFVDCKHTVI